MFSNHEAEIPTIRQLKIIEKEAISQKEKFVQMQL